MAVIMLQTATEQKASMLQTSADARKVSLGGSRQVIGDHDTTLIVDLLSY
jgi:hypothetical protein